MISLASLRHGWIMMVGGYRLLRRHGRGVGLVGFGVVSFQLSLAAELLSGSRIYYSLPGSDHQLEALERALLCVVLSSFSEKCKLEVFKVHYSC